MMDMIYLASRRISRRIFFKRFLYWCFAIFFTLRRFVLINSNDLIKSSTGACRVSETPLATRSTYGYFRGVRRDVNIEG